MWEPRRLTTLWVSTACYRDNFTFSSYTENKWGQKEVTGQNINTRRVMLYVLHAGRCLQDNASRPWVRVGQPWFRSQITHEARPGTLNIQNIFYNQMTFHGIVSIPCGTAKRAYMLYSARPRITDHALHLRPLTLNAFKLLRSLFRYMCTCSIDVC
jgi:hypothetical protein